MPLNPNQHRAVGLLAMGLSTTIVANDLGICRQTLCRWKQIPEFQEALDREVGEMMAGLSTQVQSTAHNLVEGGLEATQHLRYVMVKHGVKDQDRRICAAQLLHYAQRFYDLLGFNAKLTTPRKLQNEDLANLSQAELSNSEATPDSPSDAAAFPSPLEREVRRDPELVEGESGVSGNAPPVLDSAQAAAQAPLNALEPNPVPRAAIRSSDLQPA